MDLKKGGYYYIFLPRSKRPYIVLDLNKFAILEFHHCKMYFKAFFMRILLLFGPLYKYVTA